MDMPLVLNPECVDMDIEGDDKYSIIKNIIEKMSNACEFNHKLTRDIIKDMISRERLMSTGMQCGIALPHCSSEKIETPHIFAGICKKGIDFGSTDGTNAQIIVALVMPKTKISQHVKTMASIARLLNEEKIRNEILQAKTPQEIVEIFNKINIKD